MSAIRAGTWALLATAVAVVGLAHADPWADARAVAPLTSNRSAAHRLLPELTEVDVAIATIELSPATGPAIRIEADSTGGHTVISGEMILGPADPEAVEGLWSSLRIATSLRAAADGTDAGLGAGGSMTLSWPGQQRRLVLGAATPDEVGVYGTLEGGVSGTEGLWVLEQELSVLLSQAPRAWLARRTAVVEPSHIEAVEFADGTVLARSPDGLWRSAAAILDPHGVQTRIERIISARMDPLLPPAQAGEQTAWVSLRDIAGGTTTLATGGPCPGRPDRIVVVRGPGLAGCIDAALVSPWPMAALVHPRLAPHEYGSVLSVAQQVPEVRTLARYGGGWRLEETLAGRPIATEVDEPEVFRWYGLLHEAEVEPAVEAEPPPEPPEVAWVLTTEHGVTLTLSCWATAPDGHRRCRRDAGPMLRVRTELADLPLTADAFVDRRLVTALSVDDVRAIEILPGDARAADQRVQRQSAHFDLGVWRLDAPTHPDGDDAMDGTQLEALLAAVASVRAETWVAPPHAPPLRTIRVEQTARSGLPETVQVALHDGCVAVVPGRRPAVVSASTCRRLSADLLFTDPLAGWLAHADAVELTPTGGPTVALQRVGDRWARADGEALGPLAPTLAALAAWRAHDVLAGAAAEPSVWTLRIRPRQGAAFEVAIGKTWAQLVGADWRYAGGGVLGGPEN